MAAQKACPIVCFVVLVVHSIVPTGTSVMVQMDSPVASQTAPAAWLQNEYLRMGPGDVDTFVSGTLTIAQPFYYSGGTPIKLTYESYNLVTVVHVDGAPVTPACAAQSASWTSNGTGSISVTCSLGGGTSLDVQATLEATSMVAEFKYEVSGVGESVVTIWFGTSDDWIGTTDEPSKTIGDFVGGVFVEGGVGSSPGGRAVKVMSGEEGLYLWSTGEAKAIVAQFGDANYFVAQDPSDQPTSVTDDSSYVVRLTLTAASPNRTVFYGAGRNDDAEFEAAVFAAGMATASAVGPSAVERASAVGDPHLSNMAGEHFDIYQPGTFTLLQVPRRPGAPGATLLRVEADARRMGDVCSLYFQAVNISGTWTNESKPLIFVANARGFPEGMKYNQWMHFGPVDLKVKYRKKGVEFLNIYANSVGRTGYAVGGLLGSDDHTAVSIRPRQCSHSARSAVLVSSVAETQW